VEYIPYEDLSVTTASEFSPAYLWTSLETCLFDHHLVSEEDVFAYTIDHQLVFPEYMKDGKLVFIATPLNETNFVRDIRKFWEKWVCSDRGTTKSIS
jgi:hypothetical protein